MRKTALMLESAYNAINLIFTWFSLGNYYIFFVRTLQAYLGNYTLTKLL